MLALRGLEALHSLSGQDPTDPATTWGIENIFEGSRGCAYDEQKGGNALHALLILITALALPFARSVRAAAKWLAVAIVFGFLLLSLFVRWQIWAGYLQIPLFILWTPIIAVTLAQVRVAGLARGLALVAVLLSFFWIYNNRLRPLSRWMDGSIPARDQQYFTYFDMGAFIYPQYRSVANLVAVSGCERVGLRINSPVLEYPFWVLLREEGFQGEIQHVDVGNELSAYEDPAFSPCAIISEAAGYDPPSRSAGAAGRPVVLVPGPGSGNFWIGSLGFVLVGSPTSMQTLKTRRGNDALEMALPAVSHTASPPLRSESLDMRETTYV